MKRKVILLTLAVLLLLTSSVLAMFSTNYRLDWFTPLTGGGGGASNSTNYAVNFTVGQSVIGTSSSIHYGGCMGYWCGIREYRVFLPLVLRNYS